MNNIMLLFSYDSQKEKRVLSGKYSCDNYTFYKTVKNIHFMIKENGYGISEDVIQQLIHLGCERIEIFTTKKRMYEFTFEELLNKPIKNYGHGNQRFLNILEKNNELL